MKKEPSESSPEIKEVVETLESIRKFLEHEGKGDEEALDSSLDRLRVCEEFVQIISSGIVREKLKEMIVEYGGEWERIKRAARAERTEREEQAEGLKREERMERMSDEELEEWIKKYQNELNERRREQNI